MSGAYNRTSKAGMRDCSTPFKVRSSSSVYGETNPVYLKDYRALTPSTELFGAVAGPSTSFMETDFSRPTERSYISLPAPEPSGHLKSNFSSRASRRAFRSSSRSWTRLEKCMSLSRRSGRYDVQQDETSKKWNLKRPIQIGFGVLLLLLLLTLILAVIFVQVYLKYGAVNRILAVSNPTYESDSDQGSDIFDDSDFYLYGNESFERMDATIQPIEFGNETFGSMDVTLQPTVFGIETIESLDATLQPTVFRNETIERMNATVQPTDLSRVAEAPVQPTTGVPTPTSMTEVPSSTSTIGVPSSTSTIGVPSSTTEVPPSTSTTGVPPSTSTTEVPPTTTGVPPSASTIGVPPSTSTTRVPPSASTTGVPAHSTEALPHATTTEFIISNYTHGFNNEATETADHLNRTTLSPPYKDNSNLVAGFKVLSEFLHSLRLRRKNKQPEESH